MATGEVKSRMRSTIAKFLRRLFVAGGVVILAAVLFGCAFEGWMFYDDYYYGLQQRAISPDNSITAYWLADGRRQSTIHRVLLRRSGIHLRHLAFSGYSLSDEQSLSMTLKWSGPTNLQVICNHCNDLIFVKHDNLDGISITYLEETSSGLRPLIVRHAVH